MDETQTEVKPVVTSQPGYTIHFKFPHFALQYLKLYSDGTYEVVRTDDTAPIENVFSKFKKAIVEHFGI